MGLVDAIIGAESGGDPTARNPRSSATGAGQFIDSTWLETLAKNRPDLMQGRSREEVLALRNDPALSREMTGAYARSNATALSDAGLPVTPATSYLAHFAGPQGAVKLLTSDPSTPAAAILGEAAVRANPFMQGMTVGDLSKWAAGKVGNAQPAAPAGPAAAPATPSAPMSGAPVPPMASPDAQPSAPLSLSPQMASAQPQPIALDGADASSISMPLTNLAKARLFAALLKH